MIFLCVHHDLFLVNKHNARHRFVNKKKVNIVKDIKKCGSWFILWWFTVKL